jgi:hypothetical protein
VYDPRDVKTECECDFPIIEDEHVFGLGYRCLKCGHSAEARVDEYVERLNGPAPLLTVEQRDRLKVLVATMRRIAGQTDTNKRGQRDG